MKTIQCVHLINVFTLLPPCLVLAVHSRYVAKNKAIGYGDKEDGRIVALTHRRIN